MILDLQRRAVAAPGWRWLPGMLLIDDDGLSVRFVVELGTHALGMVQGGGHPAWRKPLPIVALPDLSDPATLGCLLALVRERWGTTAHLVRFDNNVDDGAGGTKPACWWALAEGLASRPLARYREDGSCYYIAAPTEVEVLVRALEVEP